IDAIHGAIRNNLSPPSVSCMNREVTYKEIKEAFWLLKANKAPGPDGFLEGFFKDA
ncbi:hypothetical protein U1Q18_007244, partial [Sarracenia purpurea var. burkii]